MAIPHFAAGIFPGVLLALSMLLLAKAGKAGFRRGICQPFMADLLFSLKPLVSPAARGKSRVNIAQGIFDESKSPTGGFSRFIVLSPEARAAMKQM